ncbi:MAG: hypothetical protein U0R76_08970 [Candidatus Nanopelagicales bacterium]
MQVFPTTEKSEEAPPVIAGAPTSSGASPVLRTVVRSVAVRRRDRPEGEHARGDRDGRSRDGVAEAGQRHRHGRAEVGTIRRIAERVDAAVGRKATRTVHVASDATDAPPQVPASRTKSPGLAPVRVTLAIVVDVVATLVTTTGDCAVALHRRVAERDRRGVASAAGRHLAGDHELVGVAHDVARAVGDHELFTGWPPTRV